MRIFVTGATGFVGKALIKELLSAGHNIIAGVRNHSVELPVEVEQQQIGDLGLLSEQNTLIDTLKKVDVVIHTAARVHIMHDKAADPLTEFRKTNVNATLALAKQAAIAGVKRFVFISSIKVNGESTDHRQAFRETDKPAPEDAYGQSKLEAEQVLFELSHTKPMEVVIIRPPLIYGPGVKANFASLIKIIKKGVPLPFGATSNQRSLLAIDNLVDFLMLCIVHPAAVNQVFLLADGEDVSTTILLKKLAFAYRTPCRLLPISTSWMRFVAKLLGKQTITDRLFGDLQIDISKAQSLLGWKPLTTMDQQLKKMAESDKN
ncbi:MULTISPECIES: UDP-glucose 4-epimerase family protein [unclassified Methylophaga]|uniref:UDP-glucose 4-epimerase family protein n=1 Tax=unclassified Methylophaga TaxID=2629249 RepID=UPI0025E0E6CF|nr:MULTISPECIES: SDR family oxidoreductase [unclassified Methylophaga]|tara:strand:- start:178982 stop:179938 length:957 start_codon:yes stop_codon:yes gene_type:complete